jgi:enoyl-[acyl-carrier protein] reductase I
MVFYFLENNYLWRSKYYYDISVGASTYTDLNLYIMAYGLLKGKKGIISGALDEKSIAWKVALKAKEEGASIVLTNAPIAMRMGEIKKLAEACEAEIIPADATVVEEIENLYTKSMDVLGGKVDFVLHSIGMSPNIRKGKAYGDLNYDWFMKSVDVSALSFHKFLQVAEKMDAINEWGSVVALTYMAAQRTFPFYTDMAEAKAMLESIARSYGYRYGKLKKVRVNTVSQSPTKTTAGTGIGGFDKFYDFADKIAPLGNASADDCADYVITLFSDLTRMVTMQNLFHDGGFVNTGISEDVMGLLG